MLDWTTSEGYNVLFDIHNTTAWTNENNFTSTSVIPRPLQLSIKPEGSGSATGTWVTFHLKLTWNRCHFSWTLKSWEWPWDESYCMLYALYLAASLVKGYKILGERQLWATKLDFAVYQVILITFSVRSDYSSGSVLVENSDRVRVFG